MPKGNGPHLDGRVLVKLRASSALKAARSRVNMRPLYEAAPTSGALGLGGQPRWFLAELPDGAATPWDLAHARVGDQLGVAESDLIFAEPDLIHDIFEDDDQPAAGGGLAAVGKACKQISQDGRNVPVGPSDAWHLEDDFSQLGSAREAVRFTDPRTLIAHLDTGYFPAHVTTPAHVRRDLERNFVETLDGGSAADPDNRRLILDNSGHGTGTLGILAGGRDPSLNQVIGGAPEAAVVPIRIADSVVLLRTSAFADALNYAVEIGADVLSMSMGGLPSQAWREAVDRAYMRGLCMVTAAGNNFDAVPTRKVVYPARYSRVIAACGVMADGRPYARLPGRTMEGNFGPKSVMKYALAAYTPNIPWPVYGCPDHVRRNGGGTSSATPQIAAAASLWLEKYKSVLPRDWRRVEAVREALFKSANGVHPEELGNGTLRALDALAIRPNLTRKPTKADSDSFAFLRVLTGLGIVTPPPRELMFNLEIAQRWLLNAELQKLLEDPEDPGTVSVASIMDALIEDERASFALRRHLVERYPVVTGKKPPGTRAAAPVVPRDLPVADAQPALPPPPCRRLRVFAVDPSFSTSLATAAMNDVALDVRWESLAPGPVGEYVAVEDVPIAGKPNGVNLDDPRLLAQDGWPPSEGNPQFHQQMVYAVAMTTIAHFERALGRPVLWRHGHKPGAPYDDSIFTPRLVIRPHALRQANAYYSPQDIALQFGYFEAPPDSPVDVVPGSRVYTCLSHDIIAHETTHAILDGMQRRFNEPTNPDVLAFHEAFADIIALMQHFTIPEVLQNEIRRTRGDLTAESMIGSLAVQFGMATSGRGALREAIGRIEDGVWKRSEPDPRALQTHLAPHARGAILVAAVFDAFLAIYGERIQDLIRLNTGGTGKLPDGAIHPDLVKRLSDEAAKSARHVLGICIRAIDYLPPVDMTFFEYLRALITADWDLVRSDPHNYRVAFVEAFRRRGIYSASMADPANDVVRTLSVDTLRWQGLDVTPLSKDPQLSQTYEALLRRLKRYASDCLYLEDRAGLFEESRRVRIALQKELRAAVTKTPALAEALGLDRSRSFEVHELRRAMRVSPDGGHVPQVVVSLLQSQDVPRDESTGTPDYVFRGGSTLLVDLTTAQIKYCIMKRVLSSGRRERTAAFLRDASSDPLAALMLLPTHEPFALLHSLEARR